LSRDFLILVDEDKTTYWKFIEQINFDNNFYWLIAIGYIKTASSCGTFTLKIVVECSLELIELGFLIASERSVRWPSYGGFFIYTGSRKSYYWGDNRTIVVENNYLVTRLIQIYIGFLDYFVILPLLEFIDSELKIVQWFNRYFLHAWSLRGTGDLIADRNIYK